MRARKYEVHVDDNLHYVDEMERYGLGEFETCDEETAACKRIVDEFLEQGYEKGMSFKELYEGYIGLGKIPLSFLATKHASSQLGITPKNGVESLVAWKDRSAHSNGPQIVR